MFRSKILLRMTTLTMLVLPLVVVSALGQDDDAIPGKVLDAGNRTVGKASLVPYSGDVSIRFDYNLKLWLDGASRLLMIRPESGSRASGIKASLREYKVDPKSPNESNSWQELGSGTATLQMPATGDVQRIDVSLLLTTKVVGGNDVAVSEKPQKFVIVLD